MTLGALSFETGQLDQAEEHYAEALRLQPEDPLALEHVAELRAARGDYSAAIDLYERLFETRPQTELSASLAELYTKLNRPEKAKKFHDRAVAEYAELIRRGSLAHYRQLALLYTKDPKKLSEALDLAHQDLQLRKDPYAYDTLAWIQYQRDAAKEAGAAIEIALGFRTEDPSLFYHAGMIYHTLGKLEKAQEYLSRALALNPRFDIFEPEIAQETLRSLEARSPSGN